MMIEKLENDGRTDDGDLAERAATHVSDRKSVV